MSDIEAKYIKEARERLIVALDVPTPEDAVRLVEQLGPEIKFYKLGLRLLVQGGERLAKTMQASQKNVFLDYKFHDIAAQVDWAAESAAQIGATFLTVHSMRSVMGAAVAGRNRFQHNSPSSPKLRVIAVTILTSWDQEDLKHMHISMPIEDLVVALAKDARIAGCDGVVASPREASKIRAAIPDRDFVIVTPGIRPSGVSWNDQKRVSTPSEAIAAGSDYLVVGRPITEASDKVDVAKSIIHEMAIALKRRDDSTSNLQSAPNSHSVQKSVKRSKQTKRTPAQFASV